MQTCQLHLSSIATVTDSAKLPFEFICDCTCVIRRQIELTLQIMPIILEGGLKCVEGARPDEKVISDNVLEALQPAHASVQHAARLDSHPEVCQDSIDQQEADAMAARLSYSDAEVMVELVAQADFKPQMLNLIGTICMLCCPACIKSPLRIRKYRKCICNMRKYS